MVNEISGIESFEGDIEACFMWLGENGFNHFTAFNGRSGIFWQIPLLKEKEIVGFLPDGQKVIHVDVKRG